MLHKIVALKKLTKIDLVYLIFFVGPQHRYVRCNKKWVSFQKLKLYRLSPACLGKDRKRLLIRETHLQFGRV